MTLRVLLIVAFIAFTATLQANDSLLYKTNYEKNLLIAAKANTNSDYLALYSAIDTDSLTIVKYSKRLQQFFTLNDNKVAGTKTSKAKTKFLFKAVHDHFLKQYDEVTHFSTIFETGIYNCVTASMLYSIVFEHYRIPYEIKEAPTHVYLVAFPGSDNSMVETTNPKGYFVPDEKSKRTYVDGLVATKFTTQEYVNSIGYIKAFNEFYFRNESIDRNQLGALQYYNDAYTMYRDDKTEDAIKNIAKCIQLYPTPKHEYFKLVVLGKYLDNSEYNTLKDIYYLCDYANTTKDVKGKRAIVSDFERIVNNHLFKKDDFAFTENVFNVFHKILDDKTILEEIDYAYYFDLAAWYGMKSNIDKTLEFAGKAATLNSKDVRLQEMIISAVYRKSEKQQNKKSVIKELERYQEIFSFLQTNKKFKSLVIMHYGVVSYNMFDEGKVSEGYEYLAKLQKEIELGLKDYEVDEALLGMPYAEAGAHHYRKKEYKKAKEILLKGLSYFPDHTELKERLKIVEEEL